MAASVLRSSSRAALAELAGSPAPATPKARTRPAPADGPSGCPAPGTPKVRRLAASAPGTPVGKPEPRSVARSPADEFAERLERALAALRPDGFKGKLPCREGEQEQISSHLRTAVRQGGSMQVLYISGMPGTGKTASILEALSQMKAAKGLSPFALVHVNAMRLGGPGAVFREILSQMPGATGRCAQGSAHAELARIFAERSSRDPVVVLLVDEIDHLVTQSQAVLYKLFDWLALPAPRLVFVAISNTMDLPERLLPRVASRFGIVRVDFEPYSRDQIHRILAERMQLHEAVGCFAPTAMRLCAARVAAGTGDIRKALQLCRRAAEVRAARHRETGPVDLPHLEAAEKDLLHANPAARAIGGLGTRARRFLLAVLVELRRDGADAVPLQVVSSRYSKLLAATASGDPRTAGGSAEGGAPAAAARERWHPLDEAAYLAQRLQAMALLKEQPAPSAAAALARAASGTLLALGADLDSEDLATALRTGEDDTGVLELLHESGRP